MPGYRRRAGCLELSQQLTLLSCSQHLRSRATNLYPLVVRHPPTKFSSVASFGRDQKFEKRFLRGGYRKMSYRICPLLSIRREPPSSGTMSADAEQVS